MWSLLFALVLLSITLCPCAPTWLAVPSMLVAGVLLLTWRASVVTRRHGFVESPGDAGRRGARGPASGTDQDEGSGGREWEGWSGGDGRDDCAAKGQVD